MTELRKLSKWSGISAENEVIAQPPRSRSTTCSRSRQPGQNSNVAAIAVSPDASRSVKGRGAYGLKRQSVDAAKAAGISREGLQRLGGWTDTQMPDRVYADQEADYARDEARQIRAKIRGEEALNVLQTYTGRTQKKDGARRGVRRRR